MKKVMEFKVEEGTLAVEVEMKKVEGTSAVDCLKGSYDVLKVQGVLCNKEGRLIKSGNLAEYLPINNEQAMELKELWNYSMNYVYGTLKQIEVVGDVDIKELIKDRKLFNDTMEVLKSNNLLVDRGISFGMRPLVNPLPSHILNQSRTILES